MVGSAAAPAASFKSACGTLTDARVRLSENWNIAILIPSSDSSTAPDLRPVFRH